MVEEKGGVLEGKTVYIPRMSWGGAEAFAAAFRHVGIDSRVVPDGNERTYELAGKYTSGDECLPARVTVGNFIQAMEEPGFDPSKAAFFMPTASGPCRFGQYAPFMRHTLEEMGHGGIEVISPSSRNGYLGLGEKVKPLIVLSWLALVASDGLRKLLHIYRPHETVQGTADAVYERSVARLCEEIEDGSVKIGKKAKRIAGVMEEARDGFRGIGADFSKETMLIGVVGEIYCRLSTFSNEYLIRRLEPFGAQAWLSDITEWVWYTDEDQKRKLAMKGKRFTPSMLGVMLKKNIQHKLEHTILAPVYEEFTGVEEPENIKEILDLGLPYLPWHGALGEMALSVGKTIYMHGKGVDGIIDISPFTCMNGIVSEAVYPRISRDHGGIPIRSFYFDGTRMDLENDLAIFMELVRNYSRKKSTVRVKRKVA